MRDADLAAAAQQLVVRALAAGLINASERRLVDGLGPERDLEVTLVPGRPPARRAHDAGACACPFCVPPDPRQRAVAWRHWDILANCFPYTQPGGLHLVIAWRGHALQSFSPRILGDMIDLQRLLPAQSVLHYNGLAGNSQGHLHWQATQERLPLLAHLDSATLPLRSLRHDADLQLHSFDHGFFSGLLLSGTKAGVVRMAARIVDELDGDPLTRGHYNLLLLPARAGQVRLVVIPRRADAVSVEVPGLGPVRPGAFDLAGRGVLPRAEAPDDIGAIMVDLARRTVVRPGELGWLAGTARRPAVDVVALRLAA